MATSIDTCSVTSELKLNLSYKQKIKNLIHITLNLSQGILYSRKIGNKHKNICGTTVRSQQNEPTGYGVKIL